MSALRVVLQARTTSSRLPAKALLPIAGIPSAILAGLRAARGGLDLVFATSTDPTDDLLAATAAKAGLTVFRGSKDDVLGRYAAATADLDASDTVLRITGDDPVPDGDFLRGLAEARGRLGVDMLSCLSPLDGLPHGLAAQAFTVGALRRAAASAVETHDREHVGPWMLRQPSSAIFRDLAALDAGHLRCTLDTIDDYFDLLRLFDGVTDPVSIPWRALVDRLRARSPWSGMPFRYVRGTPGGEAGVERLGALVPDADALASHDAGAAVALIRQAIRRGATHVIAAPGAGARLVGAALAQGWSARAAVILRLPTPSADLARARLADWVDTTVLGALRDLGVTRCHTVTLAPPTGARGVDLVEALERRRTEGWFRHLGVAVETATAAKHWLKRDGITHVELARGPDDFAAPGLASMQAARPEIMVLGRPRTDAGLPGALAQSWVHGAVVALNAYERLAAQVDAARAARPQRDLIDGRVLRRISRRWRSHAGRRPYRALPGPGR